MARACKNTFMDKKAAQARHHDIGRHVHACRQAEALPVLGEIADAEPHGILRRPDRHGLALDDDLAAIQRIGAEDRPCDLRPPRTHQTGEAEDLALRSLKLTSRMALLRRRLRTSSTTS